MPLRLRYEGQAVLRDLANELPQRPRWCPNTYKGAESDVARSEAVRLIDLDKTKVPSIEKVLSVCHPAPRR